MEGRDGASRETCTGWRGGKRGEKLNKAQVPVLHLGQGNPKH